MNTKLTAILVGASVALVGLAGAAIAGGDDIRQKTKYVTASNDDLVENDFYTDIGGYNGYSDNGNSVANCQWLLSVNAIFTNAVAIESLGLVEDEDMIDIIIGLGEYPWPGRGADQTTEAHNGTASCEQDIGAVRVTMQTADGFGETPPVDGDLFAAASSGFRTQNGGYGSGKVYQGVRDIYAGNDDMVDNDADVHIYGSGNAVANCQLLIAWNTAGMNMAMISQDATFEDGVDLEIGRGETTGGNGLYPPPNGDEVVTIDNSFTNGDASCKQTVSSIDIHVGDDVFIPPQS